MTSRLRHSTGRKKSRISATILAVLIFAFFCAPVEAQTPKQMQQNVFALAEAAAVLNVCFQSSAYGKLETEKALKIHELTIRLTTLVERISKKHNDQALYLAFEAMRVKMSSDVEVKEHVKNKYQYCGDQLITDMENYVTENEQFLHHFLAR